MCPRLTLCSHCDMDILQAVVTFVKPFSRATWTLLCHFERPCVLWWMYAGGPCTIGHAILMISMWMPRDWTILWTWHCEVCEMWLTQLIYQILFFLWTRARLRVKIKGQPIHNVNIKLCSCVFICACSCYILPFLVYLWFPRLNIALCLLSILFSNFNAFFILYMCVL